MVDDLDRGRRPLVQEGSDTGEALEVCPGKGLEHTFDRDGSEWIEELVDGWGPVLEMWEGFAADDEVRWLASSGGAATALALHALEHEDHHGVLHVAAREDVPYLNQTVLSRSRAELLAATGSRYAPASPCDGLQRVEDAPAPCVFVGKPCDVAGAAAAARKRPALADNLGLTIAIFCAGTPSTRGTLEMARAMGVDEPEAIDSVRYRGKGWPGGAEVTTEVDGAARTERMSYGASWGKILQKHRQWRCYVCADHTGEFADIAVGDPWYREIPPDEPGRSLVVVRTERGRQFVRAAVASGALQLERVSPDLLPASQMNLLHTRGAVWGRSLACRMLGAAAPVYRNMATGRIWLRHLSLKQRAQSIYGTFKRVFTKRLREPAPVVPFEPLALAPHADEREEAEAA
ncbi:MAG: coenzyme F420 hydrogenase [bacterium]|nr:coenzyme F420 hydrogenase [bacterium]